MVRSHYPHLLKQRRRWFVRMVVPADVRDIICQSVFKVPTGQTDEHRAATVAAPIIARRRVQNPASRRQSKEDMRQRFRPEDVVPIELVPRHSGFDGLSVPRI